MIETPEIIYEDDCLFALDKPSGMDVEALQLWIKNNLKFSISNSYELRNGLVHRLDKPTSGVILVAKTEEIFYALQRKFADREIEKTYIALAHGKIDPPVGEINAPVGRLPWKRTKFGVFDGGRSATTKYKVLKYFDEHTLVELYPKTGRTHQLRVHLKHIGHSIVSDPLYAGRKTLRSDLKLCPRLFLHAKSIEFIHPIAKKRIKIEAPLPSDLKLPYT